MSVRRGILGLGLALAACSGRRATEVVGGPDASLPDAAPAEAGDASFDAIEDAVPEAEAEAGPDVGCVAACDAAQSVGCASDDLSDCVLACDDLASAYPACLSQIAALDACTAAAPASAWSCDGDGFATLSACQTELAGRAACLGADQ